jgi:hypothetical protein
MFIGQTEISKKAKPITWSLSALIAVSLTGCTGSVSWEDRLIDYGVATQMRTGLPTTELSLELAERHDPESVIIWLKYASASKDQRELMSQAFLRGMDEGSKGKTVEPYKEASLEDDFLKDFEKALYAKDPRVMSTEGLKLAKSAVTFDEKVAATKVIGFVIVNQWDGKDQALQWINKWSGAGTASGEKRFWQVVKEVCAPDD